VTEPLILLGVSRSGTTLLRVILDRSPGVAIPDESFFVPLLARRHGRTIDAERFLDDVSRIPTIRDWGVSVADVAGRVRPGMPTGEAIAAIYEAYADAAGKPRWGDKTPMHMRHLALLDELFPGAQYVHLIRDGRDAATRGRSVVGWVRRAITRCGTKTSSPTRSRLWVGSARSRRSPSSRPCSTTWVPSTSRRSRTSSGC